MEAMETVEVSVRKYYLGNGEGSSFSSFSQYIMFSKLTYASIQVWKYESVQVCKYASMQVWKYASV